MRTTYFERMVEIGVGAIGGLNKLHPGRKRERTTFQLPNGNLIIAIRGRQRVSFIFLPSDEMREPLQRDITVP